MYLKSAVEQSNDQVKLLMVKQRAVTLDMDTQLINESQSSHFTLQTT